MSKSYIKIQRWQLWETKKAIPFIIFTLFTCVLAYFGGNFENYWLQKTDSLWWIFGFVLALMARRHLETESIIILISAVGISAVAGLIIKKSFISVGLFDRVIYVIMTAAMFIHAFVPFMDWFEYQPMRKLWYKFVFFILLTILLALIASALICELFSLIPFIGSQV